MRELVTAIFFAPFLFRFSSGLPEPRYLEDVREWLSRGEGQLLESSGGCVRLSCPTDRLFHSVFAGPLEVNIIEESGEFKFEVRFAGSRRRYYVAVAVLGILITISAIASHEPERLLAVPLLFAAGHLYFMALLAPHANQLKRKLLLL